ARAHALGPRPLHERVGVVFLEPALAALAAGSHRRSRESRALHDTLRALYGPYPSRHVDRPDFSPDPLPARNGPRPAGDDPGGRREGRAAMIAELAGRTGAALVQRIGHTAVFYRQSREHREIVLPR